MDVAGIQAFPIGFWPFFRGENAVSFREGSHFLWIHRGLCDIQAVHGRLNCFLKRGNHGRVMLGEFFYPQLDTKYVCILPIYRYTYYIYISWL